MDYEFAPVVYLILSSGAHFIPPSKKEGGRGTCRPQGNGRGHGTGRTAPALPKPQGLQLLQKKEPRQLSSIVPMLLLFPIESTGYCTMRTDRVQSLTPVSTRRGRGK